MTPGVTTDLTPGMTTSYQPSMLDVVDGGARLTRLDALRRHTLSNGAWVDHLPGWAVGSDDVLRALLDDVPWRAERRRMHDTDVDVPRLLAWFGHGSALPHELLSQALAALNRHYEAELGEPFATAGLCLYRDGRDSVAWHGDTLGRSRHQDTMIAILSLARRAHSFCGHVSMKPLRHLGIRAPRRAVSRWATETSS